MRLGFGARACEGRRSLGNQRRYLGKGDEFDEALGKFALSYADQAERDHAALKAAVRAGDIEVEIEN